MHPSVAKKGGAYIHRMAGKNTFTFVDIWAKCSGKALYREIPLLHKGAIGTLAESSNVNNWVVIGSTALSVANYLQFIRDSA